MAYRSINSVCLITQYAKDAGLSVTEILKHSGITPSELDDTQTNIEEKQELKVLENLARLKPDAFQLGLELGARYQLTSYGLWGYAVLASPNLRKAVDLGLRFLDLTYAFCHIELQQTQEKAQVVFTPKCQGPLAEFVLYRDMWAMMVIPKDLFPAGLPNFSVHFMAPQPESLSPEALAALREQVGAAIHFSQEANYVEFDRQYLDLPLPRGNELTAKMCEQQCQAILEEKRRLGGVAQVIRNALIHHGLQVSMAFVASEMSLTTRTLHRKLKDQGTSWRALKDEVRFAMAQQWLASPTMQLVEIAERLGFSDAANFSHAFKRWQGESPSQFRTRLTQ